MVAGSGAITARSSISRSIGRARSVLCIRAFARSSNQQSSCSWQSSSFAKQRPGSKERSMKSCRRSTTPLACGSRASQKCQSTRSCPQNAGEVVGRPAAGGVQAGLAIPDQRLRKRTQRPQAAPDPEQQVRGLLGEDHRARHRHASSPGTQRRHTPGASGRDRPRSRPSVPTRRTGRSRRADRRCAETCADRRRTGGPRAGSHRRSSCHPRSPAARSTHGCAARASPHRSSAADGSRP